MTTLDQLTQYHREKVIDRAYDWYRKNRSIISSYKFQEGKKIEPPEGVTLFEPSLWECRHWLWFNTIVIEKIKQRMR